MGQTKAGVGVSDSYKKDANSKTDWKDHPATKAGSVEEIPVDWIDKNIPGFNKIRRSPEEMQALASHIKQNGIQEPLVINVDRKTRQAVLGEGNHRLAAAKILGMSHVPVTVILSDLSNQPGKRQKDLATGSEGQYFPKQTAPSAVFGTAIPRQKSNADTELINQNRVSRARTRLESVRNEPKPNLPKSEELQKGAMKRLAPSPTPGGESERRRIREWQESVINREKIPRMEGDNRTRAINRIAKQTKSKMINGKRHFLLHRGMKKERLGDSSNGKNITADIHTSWTPFLKPAMDFAKLPGKVVVSAWIPEDKIHSVPNQLGSLYREKGKSHYNNEHEVLVSPHNSEIHEVNTLDQIKDKIRNKGMEPSNIDDAINARVERQKLLTGVGGYEHIPNAPSMANQVDIKYRAQQRGKLAASEEMQKGLHGDWQKEGYVISHIPHGNAIKVHAHDKNGNLIGHVTVFPHEDDYHIIGSGLRVEDAHQRKGVATAMYAHAKNVLGKPFHPTESGDSGRTAEGTAFWGNKAVKQSLSRSENLQKAPAEFPQPQIAQFPVKTPRWGRPAKTEKIKEGLFHHIYQPSAGSFVHLLSPHAEPEDGQTHFAEMVGSAKKHPKTKERLLRVHTAQVGPEHSGQGYGKLLYGLVAKHHGGIVSDRIVSPQARKVYEHFQNHPDYHVEIGERVTREPTEDEIDEQGFDRANYGTPHYLRYRPAQQGKLAASEEAMEKGVKHIAAGLAVAAGMAGAPAEAKEPSRQQIVAEQSPYTSQKMLNTIETVESNRGKHTEHKPTRSGEKAYGRFALMPDIIRDTIRMHPDLKKKHLKAIRLRGDDIHRYMQDNPSLENEVANRHLKRLEKHFGKNPEKIGYAWLNGIVGTNRALKHGKDLNQHWHVKKIKDAWIAGEPQKVAVKTP